MFMQIGSKEVSSNIDNNVSTLSTEDVAVHPNQRQYLYMKICKNGKIGKWIVMIYRAEKGELSFQFLFNL